MLGGIALGTMLALMRLSGKPWLVMPAAVYVNALRSIPLVMVILWFFLLIPLLHRPAARAPRSRRSSPSPSSRRRTTRRSCAPASSRSRGARSYAGLRGRHDLRAVHEADRPAAGLPQHAAGAADADHHPVPGHLAGLRHRRLRPAQGLRGRRQELQPAGRDLPASPPSSTSSSASACRCWCRRLQKKIAIIR